MLWGARTSLHLLFGTSAEVVMMPASDLRDRTRVSLQLR